VLIFLSFRLLLENVESICIGVINEAYTYLFVLVDVAL
jgi:hypothetical protein